MSIGIGVTEVAVFQHACEGEAVTKLTHEKIPYFNAPIYLENKIQVSQALKQTEKVNLDASVH
jgi:hypothetical protein